MNKKNSKFVGLLVIPILLVGIFMYFFSKDTFAWTSCCSPSSQWTGWQVAGDPENCCYSEKTQYTTVRCCSANDSKQSKCGETPPCTESWCQKCGNNVIESGEECDGTAGGCSGDENCESCKCVEEEFVCTHCSLSCPAPLLSSGTDEFKFTNFGSCSDNCGDSHTKDCYENPSTKPSAVLEIIEDTVPTSLGFTSAGYTGAGTKSVTVDDTVNEPVQMIGTFTDSTSGEIEALYIWFSKVSSTPVTPRFVDLDDNSGQKAKTSSTSEYGFMMHRSGSTWVPYIPSIIGSDAGDKWVRASYSNNIFSIKGPNEGSMVDIIIESINPVGSDKVEMKFSVSFNSATVSNRVSEGMYNVFIMANDTFGFTPYDNYDTVQAIKDKIGDYWAPELIRYYNSWEDSAKDWGVDLTNPSAVLNVVVDEPNLRVTWGIDDNLELYGIVLDLFIDQNYKITQLDDVTILDNGSVYTPTEQTDMQIGHLTSGTHLYKVTGMSGKSSNSSVILDVGDNRGGIFYFKMTAFDDGGNPIQASASFDLRDWMGTEGGLLYSMGGTDIAVRNFLEENGNPWIGSYIENIVSWRNIAISTELIADKLAGAPISPEKSGTVGSYMIRPYDILDVGSYYSTLKSAFDGRKASLGVIEMEPVSKLSGTLGNEGIKTMTTVGSLSVGGTANEEFVCNGSGVFFVGGDLNVYGKIMNVNANKDACIFVVRGNVYVHGTIEPRLKYEEVNAYILSDGILSINKDTDLNGEYEGVYISGGIHGLNGVSLNRYLQLKDRLTYPALLVDHHSKYGVLGRILFGGQVNIQKTEVGFK